VKFKSFIVWEKEKEMATNIIDVFLWPISFMCCIEQAQDQSLFVIHSEAREKKEKLVLSVDIIILMLQLQMK
jgi:hypothetical protein